MSLTGQITKLDLFSHATMFYGLFLATVCIFSSILYILFSSWWFVVFELI